MSNREKEIRLFHSQYIDKIVISYSKHRLVNIDYFQIFFFAVENIIDILDLNFIQNFGFG